MAVEKIQAVVHGRSASFDVGMDIKRHEAQMTENDLRQMMSYVTA
jgi:hypothetical protein